MKAVIRYFPVLPGLLAAGLAGFLASAQTVPLPPASPASALADRDLAQREAALERVRLLVTQGTLPSAKLAEAESELADAQDRVTVFRILFAEDAAQSTSEQAEALHAAATRRVDRQRKRVSQKTQAFELGIIARADVDAVSAELADREQMLSLAEGRRKLIAELQAMAASEGEAARLRERAALQSSLIRFEGNGRFAASDLPRLQAAFLRQFQKTLPVSAQGQTAVHQALGLDHRGRVDIALAPESTEGVWLRHLLEQLRIPYLAFRTAVAGAATAPHIHLGTGSPRLAGPVTMQETHAHR